MGGVSLVGEGKEGGMVAYDAIIFSVPGLCGGVSGGVLCGWGGRERGLSGGEGRDRVWWWKGR